nr:SMC-Scp complex subunit ScpB [Clostridium fermenticellae]
MVKNLNINQLEIEGASSKKIYFSIIESLLFVSGEPLNLKQIASIIECRTDFTERLLEEMNNRYRDSEDRGIELMCMDGQYSLVTKPRNSNYVEKLVKNNSRQSLSQAALETLAIIAYKQPITRIDIDEIRGVKSDRAISGLMEKNLIRDSGRLDVPGRPILYSTTDEFLKYFGFNTLNQMPQLDEFMEDRDKTED